MRAIAITGKLTPLSCTIHTRHIDAGHMYMQCLQEVSKQLSSLRQTGDGHRAMHAGGHQCSISCTAAWWLHRPRRGSIGRTSCIFREAAMP